MSRNIYVSEMCKFSTVQNSGFPNILPFRIIHYTLFSSLKNICNKKIFMSPGKLVDEKDVSCQDKSSPSKIHEVILVKVRNFYQRFVQGGGSW